MRYIKKTSFIIIPLILSVALLIKISAVFAEGNSDNLRDPFVPLVDENGIRADVFQSQAGEAGELPFKLQVMGIMYSEGSAMAIVNGEVVRNGDLIGDVKIDKIEESSVTVIYKDKPYKLEFRKEEGS